jgi:hypothetical protein
MARGCGESKGGGHRMKTIYIHGRLTPYYKTLLHKVIENGHNVLHRKNRSELDGMPCPDIIIDSDRLQITILTDIIQIKFCPTFKKLVEDYLLPKPIEPTKKRKLNYDKSYSCDKCGNPALITITDGTETNYYCATHGREEM